MTGSRLMHWILCCLVAAVGVAGCSTDTTTGEASGSLSLNLELAPGVVINEVGWTLSGNDMSPMSGAIDTSAPGATASVEVFGLPPGEDYLVELEATTEDGDTTCRGSAEFDVEIGVATPVMVMLNCKRPSRLGGVRVNGKFNICAELSKAVVSPLQTSVGNDIDLSAAATDVEGDDISYAWFATGGTIADPTAASTTYTCDEVGDHMVRIVVSDDDAEFCMDEWTVQVTCVAGEAGLCDDVTCEGDGNECTDTECNPDNGQCETSDLDGADCDEGAGMCMGGECLPDDLCDGNTCDDGDTTCNDSVCDPANGECVDKPINEGGTCLGGVCMEGICVDQCDGVICEDLGECIVNECKAVTGQCAATPVDDGAECAGGDGLCKAGDCIVSDLCDGNTCDDGDTTCNDSVCDPENGACVDKPINEGGICDGGAGTCSSGICVDMCEGVICEDLGECQDNTCKSLIGACQSSNINEGGSCDGGAGVCKAGNCAPDAVDPDPQSAILSMGCTNNVTADISILPFTLDVDPAAIIGGAVVSVSLGGIAEFSETFLDASQGAVPGGVTEADLINLAATVMIRTGGTLPATTLTNAPIATACLIDSASCDPANDVASVPGSRGNSDCVPVGFFNPCQQLVTLPTSSDCAAAGVCDGLGKLASQCDVNGFCVTGGLPLALESQATTFTAAASGVVSFGYDDQATGATINGDGTYALPAAVFTAAATPNEIKVNASGLSVALRCTMAVDSGGPDGVGVPDGASPTPDELLITFDIQ